jgi:hypothetical protein
MDVTSTSVNKRAPANLHSQQRGPPRRMTSHQAIVFGSKQNVQAGKAGGRVSDSVSCKLAQLTNQTAFQRDVRGQIRSEPRAIDFRAIRDRLEAFATLGFAQARATSESNGLSARRTRSNMVGAARDRLSCNSRSSRSLCHAPAPRLQTRVRQPRVRESTSMLW